MSIMSDSIESFIKEMMSEADGAYELKRNELASYFGCAPSQINYVLQTRFTRERGYLTESRRGGGGCIKVYRIDIDKHTLANKLIYDYFKPEQFSEKKEKELLEDLISIGVLNVTGARLILSASNDKVLKIKEPEKSAVRKEIVNSMIAMMFAQI